MERTENNPSIESGLTDAYRRSHCWVTEKNRKEPIPEQDMSTWENTWENPAHQEDDTPYDWDAWFWGAA